jgi:putative two-component system response regulator
MAYMAEYREWDNRAHLERIRRYSFIMATKLGLPSYDADIISYASQLHDIGKVCIPDGISDKMDNLEEQEWKIIESHTEVGARLLRDYSSPIFQTASQIALTHHERWDGSGYPNGLRGEEIPVSGRICAIGDVFDALTTKRPYKEEIPPEDALKLIADSSGILFDANLVRIFEDHFDDFIRIRSQPFAR